MEQNSNDIRILLIFLFKQMEVQKYGKSSCCNS
nr:MAG TPA: hypothetical protein [Caudoviricetes sp.]